MNGYMNNKYIQEKKQTSLEDEFQIIYVCSLPSKRGEIIFQIVPSCQRLKYRNGKSKNFT